MRIGLPRVRLPCRGLSCPFWNLLWQGGYDWDQMSQAWNSRWRYREMASKSTKWELRNSPSSFRLLRSSYERPSFSERSLRRVGSKVETNNKRRVERINSSSPLLWRVGGYTNWLKKNSPFGVLYFTLTLELWLGAGHCTLTWEWSLTLPLLAPLTFSCGWNFSFKTAPVEYLLAVQSNSIHVWPWNEQRKFPRAALSLKQDC